MRKLFSQKISVKKK